MRPRIESSQKTVIFILSSHNLENAMVKGHLEQGIKANELSPGLRFGPKIYSRGIHTKPDRGRPVKTLVQFAVGGICGGLSIVRHSISLFFLLSEP